MEANADIPYGLNFTLQQVILGGGPINLLVWITLLIVAFSLIARRLLRTQPGQGIFTATDVVLLLVLIGLPILHALSLTPFHYLLLMRGGVDADVPLLWGLQAIHLSASFALIALMVILAGAAGQYAARELRRFLANRKDRARTSS